MNLQFGLWSGTSAVQTIFATALLVEKIVRRETGYPELKNIFRGIFIKTVICHCGYQKPFKLK